MGFSIPPEEWANSQKVADLNAPTPEPLQPVKENVSTYEDKGTSYKGYSRKQTGTDTFTKIPQQTRFYSVQYSNAAAGATGTAARANKETHNFYATSIYIQLHGTWGATTDYFVIYDDNANNPKFIRYLPEHTQPADSKSEYILLDNCPREFTGDFVFQFFGGIGAAEFIGITLFGWEEEK